MGKLIDLTGMEFGRLTVLRKAGVSKRGGGGARWTCLCQCGAIKDFYSSNLRSGNSQSCGCLHKEVTGGINKTHGMSKTPEYISWQNMRGRCSDPKNVVYHLYGGRGITVCEEWDKSFSSFFRDMGPRPSPLHTIDRINNDLGYCKSNCRWALPSEQARNKRNTRFLSHDGRTLPLQTWAEESGICVGTIWSRIEDLGWTESEAVTTPVWDKPERNKRFEETTHSDSFSN